MLTTQSHSSYINWRLTTYQILKFLMLITACGLIIQYAICDSVLIKSDHMEPLLHNGDRVIVSKLPVHQPLNWIFKLHQTQPVIFTFPHHPGKRGCLRIGAMPGDTVNIQDGMFTLANIPGLVFAGNPDTTQLLPGEYSPRDNLIPYRIPEPADTLMLDSLSIRDFIFCYSIITQENPHKHYRLKPVLYIDDSLTNDYIIKDFSLYTGAFDSIADSLHTDWFFWDRLNAFLGSLHSDNKITLTFLLMEDQSIINFYCVKDKFYFLISDNWCGGYDSRYFGPVISSNVNGHVVGVLWSFAPDRSGLNGLRGRRIFKIIK